MWSVRRQSLLWRIKVFCLFWTCGNKWAVKSLPSISPQRFSVTSEQPNTITFPRRASAPRCHNVLPTRPPSHDHFCIFICSRRCWTKELETASSNAANVEKPSSTNTTWRSTSAFTAVSRRVETSEWFRWDHSCFSQSVWVTVIKHEHVISCHDRKLNLSNRETKTLFSVTDLVSAVLRHQETRPLTTSTKAKDFIFLLYFSSSLNMCGHDSLADHAHSDRWKRKGHKCPTSSVRRTDPLRVTWRANISMLTW